MSKDEVIKKVYYDPSGFGSRKNTLESARKRDKTITKDDVDNCMLKTPRERRNLEAIIRS